MKNKSMDIYSPVKSPQLRQVLMFSLENLSNKDRQLKKWVDPNYLHAFWDTLRFDINVIYNDLDLDENPEDQIGYALVNQEEADIINPVTKALDKVYDEIGPKRSDFIYINSSLWDEVVKAAQAALKVFLKNEEEARKLNPHPWDGTGDWPPSIPS